MARNDLDFGTLLCYGTNSLGQQKMPCVYRVIPAGLPLPPDNCTVRNTSALVICVECSADVTDDEYFVLEISPQAGGEGFFYLRY